jgi:hypothetical protein
MKQDILIYMILDGQVSSGQSANQMTCAMCNTFEALVTTDVGALQRSLTMCLKTGCACTQHSLETGAKKVQAPNTA